jgi:hypothetical protein
MRILLINKARHIIIVLLIVPLVLNVLAQKTPAFPGAEGFGEYTTGGRGGRVIKITNLNDSGEGSFRAAVEAEGPRIVVFEVSGTIPLESKLYINKDDLTIAGQTAPGDGICLKNYCVYITASNVIIRYMRFRMGDEHKQVDDALGGQGSRNMIIDHCSMSWSIDECASFYANENFTMQWCLMTESLRNAFHYGAHGFGGIWGGNKATFHHNLLAHHTSRNPRLRGHKLNSPTNAELVDIRNNVFYNYGHNGAYGSEGGGSYNMVNNYYKYGPGTKPKVKKRFLKINAASAEYNWLEIEGSHGVFYIDGNYVYGNDLVTSDNWAGGVEWEERMSKDKVRSKKEFAHGSIVTDSAKDAYEKILQYAGASLKRDAVDTRAVKDTRTGTASIMDGGRGSTNGYIDTQSAVGGWPVLKSKPAPIDTDGDGMPDEWEMEYNLNPKDPTDGNNDKDGDGYDNIENYINSLVVQHVDTKPIVQILNPVNEQIYFNSKKQNVEVEINANDYNSGEIEKVELFLDNSIVLNKSAGRISTTLKNVPKGYHEIVSKVTDNTGNVSTDTSTFFIGEKVVRVRAVEVENGKVRLEPSGGVYTEGINVKVTAVADEGYVFSKWENNLSLKNESFSIVTKEKPFLFKPVFVPITDDKSKYFQPIKINFQPEKKCEVPEGYLADFGGEFNEKLNGFTYGWMEGYNSSATFNTHADSLLWKSGVSFRIEEEEFSWGIKLPKGKYKVKIVIQRVKSKNGEFPILKVERNRVDPVSQDSQFVEYEVSEVEVHEEKLNISCLNRSRICFVEIVWVDKL